MVRTQRYLFRFNQNVSPKVRRTLAFSLHAVANILGEEMTEEVLLPTFDVFFSDVEEVKIGVIKNLSKFLKVVSLPVRKKYLESLEKFQESEQQNRNWRPRRLIAKQMGKLAELYDPETVATVLVPILKRFLCDPVSSVRSALLKQMSQVINGISDEKQKELLVHLKGFSQQTTPIQLRIWFCKACPFLVGKIPKEIFEEYFVESLIVLSSDKIANTRIYVAEALTQICSSGEYSQDSRLVELLQTLQGDKDRDVSICARTVVTK